MEEMIRADDIYKKISFAPSVFRYLLQNGNLVIYKGEFAALTGNSGSGKSTLLDILQGYDHDFEGKVRVANADIKAMVPVEFEKFRSETIGFCSANRASVNLNETVKENISRRAGCFKINHPEEHAAAVLKSFGLNPVENEKILYDTSQYYRLMLAMAYCGSPPILIIDEVLDYFAPEEGKKILAALFSLQKKHQTTIVVVTQDLGIIKKADRAFCIKDQTIYKVDLPKLRKLTE